MTERDISDASGEAASGDAQKGDAQKGDAQKGDAISGNGTFAGSGEPVAIVGMACRFPQADELEAFWRLLDDGVNAVTEGVPGSGIGRIGELFPDADVRARACRFGAYLNKLDRFDAAF
ncbi:MAG: beta-ketoacyl synthase N-terminal-like domain-containing protein, partial [Rhodospirillaceae bacterium]|nr:beta-ketoacyl synthase N-terminal-like domain-containing protein [Rhodospirillaceae bacterium]